MQIKTVLFDLGNVLVFIDFNEFWRSLGFLNPEEIAPFADGYKSLTRQYETGFIPTNEYLTGLQSVFGHRFNVEQIEYAFANIIQKPIDGMTNLVRRVSRTHRTALVSNTNDIHYKISLEKFDALNVLQKYYLSYQMRVMKPARGFYEAIIKDQKIDPSEILFVDDLMVNIESARAAGMQAIKFENTEQLEMTLKALGVLE